MRGNALDRETEFATTHWRSRSLSVYGELLCERFLEAFITIPQIRLPQKNEEAAPVPAGRSTCSVRLTATTQMPWPRSWPLPSVTAGARKHRTRRGMSSGLFRKVVYFPSTAAHFCCPSHVSRSRTGRPVKSYHMPGTILGTCTCVI